MEKSKFVANINIGDCVQSNIVPTMIGKIVKIVNENVAIVMIKNREIIIDLDCWHKVEEK